MSIYRFFCEFPPPSKSMSFYMSIILGDCAPCAFFAIFPGKKLLRHNNFLLQKCWSYKSSICWLHLHSLILNLTHKRPDKFRNEIKNRFKPNLWGLWELLSLLAQNCQLHKSVKYMNFMKCIILILKIKPVLFWSQLNNHQQSVNNTITTYLNSFNMDTSSVKVFKFLFCQVYFIQLV